MLAIIGSEHERLTGRARRVLGCLRHERHLSCRVPPGDAERDAPRRPVDRDRRPAPPGFSRHREPQVLLRVAEVLGHGEDRPWLLLIDAGQPIGALGNPPGSWLNALPLYAELQRGETAQVEDHLLHGVPDLRLPTLPDRYEDLVRRQLPLKDNEITRMRRFTHQFTRLCEDLSTRGVPETIQHDDLHDGQVFVRDGRYRFFDWGDSCVSHPFHSLTVTLRAVAWKLGLKPGGPDLRRLRDAYLEPFGELNEAADIAYRTGTVARSLAWHRMIAARPPELVDEDDATAVAYGLKLFLGGGPIGTFG